MLGGHATGVVSHGSVDCDGDDFSSSKAARALARRSDEIVSCKAKVMTRNALECEEEREKFSC